MFNTKKINEQNERINNLSNKLETLRKQFVAYIEKTKPAAKFKMFDEVIATYYVGYRYGKRTANGKVTKITYDYDSLEYKYEVTDNSSDVCTCREANIKLDESNYIHFSVECDPTRWNTDRIDIGDAFANSTASKTKKLPKKSQRKAKR